MVVWLLLLDHAWPVFSAIVIAFTVYVLVRAITGTWKVGTPPLNPKGFVGPKVEVYVGERNAEGKRHGGSATGIITTNNAPNSDAKWNE